ncbi:putative Flagellin and related hook-associated proteins [uncultured Desulfatiglans sp.]|nr:putative Flagellin and related hook-associated proteins [uncultured Desulfatiglans sp.]
MRVTNKLLADTVNQNLLRSVRDLLKTEEVVSSGKRINKPSDDPVGSARTLHYRRLLGAVGQYERNMNHADAWLKSTESALGTANDLLVRAKELAVYQASETASAETRAAAAAEVKVIWQEMLRLANTRFGETYIFAGHQTDSAPFAKESLPILTSPYVDDAVFSINTDEIWTFVVGAERFDVSVSAGHSLMEVAEAVTAAGEGLVQAEVIGDGPPGAADRLVISLAPDRSAAVIGIEGNTSNLELHIGAADAEHIAYRGDQGLIAVNMGENIGLNINFTGQHVFTEDDSASGVNIFYVLDSLCSALEENDTTAIQDRIVLLDSAQSQVLGAQSELGARLNRVEMARNYWSDFELATTQLLSETEDADMVEAMTRLSLQETIYNASLGIAGRMLQQTLLDFIK